MSKKPKGNNTAVVVLLTVLIFVMIALTGLVIWMCVNLVNKTPQASVRTEAPKQVRGYGEAYNRPDRLTPAPRRPACRPAP